MASFQKLYRMYSAETRHVKTAWSLAEAISLSPNRNEVIRKIGVRYRFLGSLRLGEHRALHPPWGLTHAPSDEGPKMRSGDSSPTHNPLGVTGYVQPNMFDLSYAGLTYPLEVRQTANRGDPDRCDRGDCLEHLHLSVPPVWRGIRSLDVLLSAHLQRGAPQVRDARGRLHFGRSGVVGHGLHFLVAHHDPHRSELSLDTGQAQTAGGGREPLNLGPYKARARPHVLSAMRASRALGVISSATS